MTDLNISTDSPDFLTDDSLHEAYELDIQSGRGENVRFGEIVASKGDSVTSIVIFVRHFFCLYDQDYVRTLAGQITQSLLDTVPSSAKPAQVIIIGCGDPALIGPYMEETSDEFPIYSDPSGKIYETLKMKRSTDGFTDPPPYTSESFSTALGKALKQMWKRGWAGLKGGNWDQQGGEWIFQRGKLRYAHRMEGASDHLTAERLCEILSVDHDPSNTLISEGPPQETKNTQDE
ncbi:uncharacterized protein N7484_010356 [Penicillium longicatenatum]|uniref:uncharacterized protein n=1 Tax=Penicillium longicatenatum TaxID=1561947 RepID=UPI002548CE71|nr:uncharacterized protein N7484_010356 [Penicillium longicatenatum]KAJ5630256.1 hypothetical protein N7484_010356 [Penicillium longicatenatum]